MDKPIENTKTISCILHEFNPLVSNLFVIVLPNELNIVDWKIQGFEVADNVISVNVIETKEQNIRDTFEDINAVNELMGKGKNILISYLDPTGCTFRKEAYTNVKYTGESYSGYNYSDTATVVTTKLNFIFEKRKNVTAN